MSEPELNPQEPGALNAGADRLAAIADSNVGDLVEALDTLGVDELEKLAALEKDGKNRTTALGAISRELQSRAEAETQPGEVAALEKSALGDKDSYARMHAKDIDPRKLEHPVLTLDGWLLPLKDNPDA